MNIGGKIRRAVEPTTTSNLDGIWRLNTIANFVAEGKWPVWTAGGGTFDPTSITGLFAWYDASDSTTRTLDPSYGRVTQWDDKSGNGHHLKTDSTLYVSWPQVTAASQNGLDAFYFANRPDLVTDAFSPIFTSAGHTVTIFAALHTPDADSSMVGRALTLSSNSGTDRGYQLQAGLSTSARATITLINNLSNLSYQFSTHTSAPTLFSVVQDGSGYTAYRNGTLDGTFAFSPPADSVDKIWVGSQNNNGTFKGSIFEIAVYTSAVGDSDRQAMESYLMTKWGIA